MLTYKKMEISPTEVCSTPIVKLQFGALIFDKKL